MCTRTRHRISAVVAVLSLLILAGVGSAAATTRHKHHRHHHQIAKLKATVKPKTSAGALGKQVAFGAYASGFGGTALQITQLERQLGAHLAIASSFRGLGDVFPDATQRAEASAGHTLLIAWDLGDSAYTRFTTFTDGSHDAYLSRVAQKVAAFGKPVYLRPWAEMNADWTAFQPTADGSRPAGGTPEEFVAAWRYLVSFFDSQGATNARWVFNPTTDTYAETTDVRTIFPGAAYVDVLGLDGYNWGNGGVLRWQSFESIYSTQYQRLVALDDFAPVWVCEFASKEPSENDGAPVDSTHSKAAWYRQLLASTAFPAVRALVMFDVDKERDWRLGSDPAALEAVSAAVRSA
jgi:hypothetical protein